MTMPPEEISAAIEAILFVSGEPVTVEDLAEVLSDATKQDIETSLGEIRIRFEAASSGIALEQAAGGYRFATRAQFDPFLRKVFSKQNEGRLSIAALETLAIIAYRQPITLPEISDIRGVNSSAVLRTLLERRMIRIAGRKNVVGSPFLYRTTKDFLVHFGLNAIQDLPQLEEFTEILGENVIQELAFDTSGGGRFESDETDDETLNSATSPDALTSESGHPDKDEDAGTDSSDVEEVEQETSMKTGEADQLNSSPSSLSDDMEDVDQAGVEEQEEAIEVMTSNNRQN